MTTHRRMTRRDFGAALGAAAAALACGHRASAQPAADARIDVHHHILPPEYVRLVGREAIGRLSPNAFVPDWTVARSLDVMDEAGVSGAVVSVSAPGIALDDRRAAQRLARSCNEFAAEMAANHPTRFGFFAVLPLPDVEASIRELGYAVETLRCDGVGLITNYADRYLGDPLFAPLFEEINRRRLVVYVHPNVCSCDRDVLPGVPASMIEFPHSTTRTIVSLLGSGTFARCPNARFIFSHAGGTVPFLTERITSTAQAIGQPDWLGTLRTLYYDTAGSANLFALEPLLRLVTAKRVLLGTDFPFAAAEAAKARVAALRTLGLPEDAVADIGARNAQGLFGRFA